MYIRVRPKQYRMTAHKPTTLLPFLTVSNCKKAVDFYISAFGATETTKHEHTNNKQMSKIDIEGASFWIGDEEPEFGNVSPDPNGNAAVRIILVSNNADHLYDKALQCGATQICPMTTETIWRIGKLKDPFGHVWEIGYTL